MEKVVTSEKVLVGSDFNGHVGSDMGGFGEVHGSFGIGQINDGGIRLLDWEVGKGLCGLKRKLLDVASEVCGYTKDKPRHFETWWWNKDVDVVVCSKRELFRIRKHSWNEEAREKYCEAKKDAKRVVCITMDQKLRRRWRRLIHVVMVVSCLELPNKGLGRREMLLGLVVLKIKLWR